MRHMRFTEQSAIGTLFDHAAAHLPQGTMQIGSASPVLGPAAEHSYGQLAGAVHRLSGWFPALGVRPGDRVAIAKANHPDIVVLAAAAARAGAVPALLSASVPADDARVLLDRVQPAAVLADRAVIEAWGLTGTDPWRLVAVDGPAPGAVPADDLRGSSPAPAHRRPLDEPMVVTHTSGTTGIPKLVMHSGTTLTGRARMVTLPIPLLSFRRRDRYAAYLPWAHARAVEFFTSTLHIGCPALAVSDPHEATLPAQLGPFRPTVIESVPNVYLLWEGLAARAGDLFAHVRVFLNAFDAMHPRTVRALLDPARPRAVWLQGYGQSEVGCITVDAYTRRTVRAGEGRPATLRSMGWPSPPMTAIRATHPDTGARVRRGEVGQLEVRTRGRVLTYVGQEDLHARRVRGSWWTTGDLGYLTRSGRTILQDRHIDAVDGIDSCLEIEDRLLDALPEATEVAIVKVDGRAVPVVCTDADRPLDPERWAAAVAPLGAPLAPPVHLPWDEVPRTGTYKVRRPALADRLRQQAPVSQPERTAARHA